MVRSGKELKTEEGKARSRGHQRQENTKISQNLKSLWKQVDHLVRVRSSNASSSEARWQEDYKEVVIALTVSGPKGHCLTMSSFHACFLTSSSISCFIAFCFTCAVFLDVSVTACLPSLREGVNGKKTFSFGHCPNHLNPPPDPDSGNLVVFFRTSKFKIWKSV